MKPGLENRLKSDVMSEEVNIEEASQTLSSLFCRSVLTSDL